MTIVDEKDLTNQFLCMSVKFLQFDHTRSNELSFQQANSIYDNMRAHLRETGDAEIADQKYFINSGRKFVFNRDGNKAESEV